jgi:dihydrofolate reductase
MVIGGADLATTFAMHDLIDECWLYVNPVLLGRGNPLFKPSAPPRELRLVESRTFGGGVQLPRYARDRE